MCHHTRHSFPLVISGRLRNHQLHPTILVIPKKFIATRNIFLLGVYTLTTKSKLFNIMRASIKTFSRTKDLLPHPHIKPCKLIFSSLLFVFALKLFISHGRWMWGDEVGCAGKIALKLLLLMIPPRMLKFHFGIALLCPPLCAFFIRFESAFIAHLRLNLLGGKSYHSLTRHISFKIQSKA